MGRRPVTETVVDRKCPAASGSKISKVPANIISLDDLREALPHGTWRRLLQDYHARFTADIALRWTQDVDTTRCKDVTQVIVSQRARLGSWDGSDPMTTGATVWDSALVLALFFKEFPSKLAEQRVLELGSGTGLAGLVARRFGAAEVVLTDLPSMQELLQANAQRNFPGASQHVLVRPLVWQDVGNTAWLRDGHTSDLLLMSDLLYNESAVEPLLVVLNGLARIKSSPGPLRGFWAQELHSPDVVQRLHEGMQAAGWKISLIKTISDGTGPDVILSEVTGPDLPPFKLPEPE